MRRIVVTIPESTVHARTPRRWSILCAGCAMAGEGVNSVSLVQLLGGETEMRNARYIGRIGAFISRAGHRGHSHRRRPQQGVRHRRRQLGERDRDVRTTARVTGDASQAAARTARHMACAGNGSLRYETAA
jgi:hypothetical protein